MKRLFSFFRLFTSSCLLLLLLPLSGFGEVVFQDNFSNNNNNWYESSDSDTYIKVTGGTYLFHHKRDKDAWFTWQTRSIDESQDFRIETTLTKKSGIQNYGAGLFWGASDLDNRYSFLITANGYYKFFKYENGVRKDFIDWTTSYLINQGNGGTNTIAVEKKGNKFKFYINGSFVDQYEYQSKFGNQFGFEVDNNSKIAFDNLMITQTRAATVAQPTYTTKTTSGEIVLFFDDFSSNSKRWVEDNTGEVYMKVTGGAYVFDHKRDKDAWFSWQPISISDEKDYTISATLTRKKGVQNYGTGFFWGASDLDNRYSYLITANGYFKFFKFENGSLVSFIDWTYTDLIHQGDGATNNISAEKKGNKIKFYINGSYAGEYESQPMFGSKSGFEVDNRNTVHFDDFKVTQSTPTYKPIEEYKEPTYIVETDKTPPEIVITSSKISRGVKIVEKSKRIRVEGRVTDSSGVVDVIVNDREAHLDAKGNFSANVYLKVGNNKILVRAMDTYENVATKEFTVYREAIEMEEETPTVTQLAKKKGGLNWYTKQYAIVVGIDRYNNSGIPALENAVNDAKSISGMLKSMNYTVYELYNDQASKKNILGNFKKVRKDIQEGDSIIFYFAGHGQGIKMSTGNKSGYIIPYDSNIDLQGNSVIDYDEEAISLSYLKKIAEDLNARHIALLLDSCFSGLAMKRSIPSGPNVLDTEYYNDILSRRAINILTAGDDQPVSDGSGHSPFAKALLQALQDKGADISDRDGYVTFNQLSAYVKEKVEKATSRRQRPQFDNLIDDDGDFVFKVR